MVIRKDHGLVGCGFALRPFSSQCTRTCVDLGFSIEQQWGHPLTSGGSCRYSSMGLEAICLTISPVFYLESHLPPSSTPLSILSRINLNRTPRSKTTAPSLFFWGGGGPFSVRRMLLFTGATWFVPELTHFH